MASRHHPASRSLSPRLDIRGAGTSGESLSLRLRPPQTPPIGGRREAAVSCAARSDYVDELKSSSHGSARRFPRAGACVPGPRRSRGSGDSGPGGDHEAGRWRLSSVARDVRGPAGTNGRPAYSTPAAWRCGAPRGQWSCRLGSKGECRNMIHTFRRPGVAIIVLSRKW